MKQILEQYAAGIIASMLAMILLGVINHGNYGYGVGISQILELVVQDSVSAEPIAENGVLEDYLSDTAMDLEVKSVYVIANQQTSGEECFTVKNARGETFCVLWKKAWNLQWEEVDVGILADGSSICFSDAGCYWVQIYTLDKNAKEHSWIVKLLVNER